MLLVLRIVPAERVTGVGLAVRVVVADVERMAALEVERVERVAEPASNDLDVAEVDLVELFTDALDKERDVFSLVERVMVFVSVERVVPVVRVTAVVRLASAVVRAVSAERVATVFLLPKVREEVERCTAPV